MIDMSHSTNDVTGVGGGAQIDIPPPVGTNDIPSPATREDLNSPGLSATEQDLPTELPPFSFRKKPIMYSSIHSRSNISDLIPRGGSRLTNRTGSISATSDASGGSSSSTTSMTSAHSTSSTNPTSSASSIVFKDFDYDEQIRAPRMANPTTAAAIVRRGEEEPEIPSPFQSQVEPLPASKDPPAKYHPAIFDLTKPTRRFSVPEVQEDDDFILNYTTNNYIYDKQTTITFSSNYREGRIRNQPSINSLANTANELSTITSNDQLKCMYELKKPMCIPAVLRPNTATTNNNLQSHIIVDNSNSGLALGLENASTSSSPLEYALDSSVMAVKNANSPHGSLDTSIAPDAVVPTVLSRLPMSPELEVVRTNSTSISMFNGPTSRLFEGANVLDRVASHDPELSSDAGWRKQSLQSLSGESMKEPTHIHWKPQNEFCMKCFEPFGLLRRRRRHHCRFCGLLICSYCLQDSSQESNSNHSPRLVAYNSQPKDGKNRPKILRGDSHRSIQDGESPVPKGILLDAQARFVIPINNAFDVFSHFKASKVCKNCGELYGKLLTDVRSQRLPFNYVFIENPYVKKRQEADGANLMRLQGERGQSVVVLTSQNGNGGSANISSDFLTPSTTATSTSSSTIVASASERETKQISAGNDGILTDWTWSSF